MSSPEPTNSSPVVIIIVVVAVIAGGLWAASVWWLPPLGELAGDADAGQEGGRRSADLHQGITSLELTDEAIATLGVEVRPLARSTFEQVEQALRGANENATGGYVETGPHRLLVRVLGRIENIAELNNLVIDGTRQPPVLMTALTSGIGLVPLILAGGEPGKEILYPVATVIVGGLMSSTLLDFFVHPALFWTLGRKEAQRLADEPEGDGAWGGTAEAQAS